MNKHCKNCNHYHKWDGWYDTDFLPLDTCRRESDEIDYVNGGVKKLRLKLPDERMHGGCGKEGKYFEPKTVPIGRGLSRVLRGGKE